MAEPRTVGVLGGMGPLATADLYRKIIQSTPATRDQDHLPVIIDADPSVPDRTDALLHGGADPVPHLVRGSQRLEAAGAAFIVMPCNTAHAFLGSFAPSVAIPVVSMIDESARVVAELAGTGATAGILATSGTIAANLYQEALSQHGCHSIVPGESEQARVTQAIGMVKSGQTGRDATKLVQSAATELVDGGATVLLAACTELPVILMADDVTVPLVDPTQVLADAAVAASLNFETFFAERPTRGNAEDNVS